MKAPAKKKTAKKRRALPGTTGKGKFFHIQIRPKGQFTTFRVQDVGEKGGLERLAGKRPNGSWDTVTWLVSKEDASVDAHGHLKIKGKAASILKQIKGRIVHVKGDVFHAHPKNVPERDKPTPAMRRAQRENIKKAQSARRK